MNHGARIIAMVACFLLVGGTAAADPCLVVYPEGPCVYHYDVTEYYTVMVGDTLYDPLYDRGGEVLIDIRTNEIALDIYEAPALTGFAMSSSGQDGYFFFGSDSDIVVRAFSNVPTLYENVLLVFVPDPEFCTPIITVDGSPVLFDPGLGYYFPIGDIAVSMPTKGNNYTNSVTVRVVWELCFGVRIWAFADVDYNLAREGDECFSAFSHDATLPVESTTWGEIKRLYAE